MQITKDSSSTARLANTAGIGCLLSAFVAMTFITGPIIVHHHQHVMAGITGLVAIAAAITWNRAALLIKRGRNMPTDLLKYMHGSTILMSGIAVVTLFYAIS